ncbi:MAG: protein kinase [Magnetococcales bacterium]|nr:protein kinase [Magnetococcales bacterium]
MSPRTNNALPIGTRLLQYQITGVLGQGGFGITYLAQDVNLDHQVAIKEFLPGQIAARQDDATVQPNADENRELFALLLQRFLQEARTLAQLKHPNIIRVYNYFEANNTACFVMEYEEGMDLLAFLGKRSEKLREEEIMDLLNPLLDGLQLLHSKGFVHRDIKPANIFIRLDGSPVLLDFGATRNVADNRQLTVIATPDFAPPEQFDHEGQQGPWTDIFALAGVLYLMVAQSKPARAAQRMQSWVNQQKDTLRPALEVGRGQYSESFLNAIDRGLQLRERDRPQSIAEWRNLFSDPDKTVILSSPTMIPLSRSQGSPGEGFSSTRQEVSSDLTSKPTQGKKSSLGFRLLIGLLLMVLAGVGGFYSYKIGLLDYDTEKVFESPKKSDARASQTADDKSESHQKSPDKTHPVTGEKSRPFQKSLDNARPVAQDQALPVASEKSGAIQKSLDVARPVVQDQTLPVTDEKSGAIQKSLDVARPVVQDQTPPVADEKSRPVQNSPEKILPVTEEKPGSSQKPSEALPNTASLSTPVADREIHSILVEVVGSGNALSAGDKSHLSALESAKQRAMELARQQIVSRCSRDGQAISFRIVPSDNGEEVAVLDQQPWTQADKTGVRIRAEIRYAVNLAPDNPRILADPTLPLTVRVWTEQKAYRRGEEIRVHLRGNRDFHARVVDLTNEGQIIQLLPNALRGRDNVRFQGGVTHTLPDPAQGDKFNMRVQPPYGKDTFMVFASDAELGQPQLEKLGPVLMLFKGNLSGLTRKVREITARIDRSQDEPPTVNEFVESHWSVWTKE